MITELASAATLGLLTAISPCPLATNIAAVSYLGRHAGTPRRSLWSGAAYVAGRTICYAVLAAALVGGLLAATTASSVLNRYFGLLVGSLVPLAAKSESVIAVPVTYGVATGLPVLAFAVIIALGGHGVGKAFDLVKSIEKWLRLATGLILVGVGLFLCLRTNLGV